MPDSPTGCHDVASRRRRAPACIDYHLGHSIAPVLNLYDFAEDPGVRLLAKGGVGLDDRRSGRRVRLPWGTMLDAIKIWLEKQVAPPLVEDGWQR